MKSLRIHLLAGALAVMICCNTYGAVGNRIIEGGVPDWPSAMGDMGHSGHYSGEINAPVTLFWEARLDAGSSSSPVVVDGFVYAADTMGHCYAFDSKGNLLWKIRLNSNINVSPLVSGGRMFIGTGDGKMHALDAGTGREIWSAKAGTGSITSAVAAAGSVLFGIGVPDNKLVSLNALKGKKLWERTFSHPITGAPSIGGNAVFAGTGQGDAVKMSLLNGRIIWTRLYTQGTFQGSSISIDGIGAVLCPGSYDRGMYQLAEGDGRTTGSFSIPSQAPVDPIFFRQLMRMRPERQGEYLKTLSLRKPGLYKTLATEGFAPFGGLFSSTPALSGSSMAVVQSEAGYPGLRMTLRMVDRRNAGQQWIRSRVIHSDIPDYCVAPVLCANGVIASLGDEELMLCDAKSGEVIWSQKLDSRMLASPAVYNNRIFAVTSSGVLYAFQGTGSSFVPGEYDLGQNFPNPFNPVTEIAFSLPINTRLTLSVFNVKGEKVVDLVNGYKKAGYYSIRWNGKNSSGVLAASGVYFYRLSSDKFIKNRRMIFVK